MVFNYSDMIAVSPILFLSVFSLLLLVVDVSVKKPATVLYWLTLIGLAITGFLTVNTYNIPGSAFNGMVFTGKFPAFFEVVFVLSAALSVLLSKPYLEKIEDHYGE